MKPYMPAIVVLVILAALVGGGLMTANMLKSPQATFTREVDAKVEQAQRLLLKYQGGQPALVAALDQMSKAAPPGRATRGEPTTQPASAATADANETATPGEPDYLKERQVELDDKRGKLDEKLAAAGGEAKKTAPEFTTLDELENRIKENAAILDEALTIVRDAINTPGTNELSGTSHAVATRLEAQLLYQKADLLRRQASVRRALAAAERAVFDRVVLGVREAGDTVETIQRELNGTAGGTIGGKAAAPDTAAAKGPKAKPAAKQPAAPGAKDAGGGLMDKIRGLLGKKPKVAEPTEQPSEPGPEPATPPASDNEADKPAEEPKPAVESTPVEVAAVPSIDERIKQLHAQGVEVDAQVAEAQKEADQLSAAVKGLETELATARSRSDDAQKRMMELVNAGVDPVDPKAMQQFADEYAKAAKADREAAHEAAALKDGMLRNAKPDAQEENEILTAPIVPADGSGKIQEAPGLTALQADLRASEALVSTRQDLRKLIDVQIKTLQTRREELIADLAKAQAWKAGLAKEAAERVTHAAQRSDEALKLENEAIETLQQGQTAARQAKQAATDWSGKVAEFYRKNAAPAPQTGYMAAHAEAVAGDIEMQRACVLAQQAEGLQQQEILLGRVPATQPAAAPATQPASAAGAAREEALKAADAALELYKEAAGKLGGLWTLHTQMAAVHYLKATLLSGDEAQKERAEGLKEYQSATRDRGELARDYRPMIQSLSAQ